MRALVLLLITILALPGFAVAQKLYKWTDENGVTQYTDSPPPDTAFESREIAIDPEDAPQDGAQAAADDAVPLAGSAPAARQYDDEERANACTAARQMYGTIEDNPVVRMDLDGDGEPEQLDSAARQAQLERARGNIERFCEDQAP